MQLYLAREHICGKMAYDNSHKTVLQTIMHEGALEEDRGKQLVEKLFGT